MIETFRKLGSNRGFQMKELYCLTKESRQNHHQKLARSESKEIQEEDLALLVSMYRIDHPRMGSRQLYKTMSNNGEQIGMGITKFEQFMSRKGLTIPVKRTKKPKTSDGKGKGAYPNLTNGLELNGPDQLIVADITYYDLSESRCYIFTLKDVYTQAFIALVVSKNMKAINALECLKRMQEFRGMTCFIGCIHHSDHGSQYDSKDYRLLLKQMSMLISRADNCLQNGSAEQMNHVVKNMYLDPWEPTTFEELEKACARLVELNNNHRAIKQLGDRCPIEFEKWVLSVPEEERPIKKMYDFNEWN